jgi:hypothetical protein
MHGGGSLLNDPLVLPESVANLSEAREQLLLGNIGVVAEFIDILFIIIFFIGLLVQVSHNRDLRLTI